jgi:hypothetical protein
MDALTYLLPFEPRVSNGWTNVSNLANCEDNKVLLFEHDGLLDSIMRMAHLDLCERSDTTRVPLSWTYRPQHLTKPPWRMMRKLVRWSK